MYWGTIAYIADILLMIHAASAEDELKEATKVM